MRSECLDIHELFWSALIVACTRYNLATYTGDPEATLTDGGRRPKLLTCYPGWFPKLHEIPGMSKDSTLAAARSGQSPSVGLCRPGFVYKSDVNIFYSSDFRGYNYTNTYPLCCQGASYEVVFEADARKAANFKEILTKSG